MNTLPYPFAQTIRLIVIAFLLISMLFNAMPTGFALGIPQTDQSKVKLLNGEIYDASYTEWGLRGSIEVANIAYNKSVQICYTYGGSEFVLIDGYTTTCGSAKYTSASPTVGKEIWSYDFRIPKVNAPSVQYVVKYTVNGSIYWDNNFGKNYPTSSAKSIRIYYATTQSTTNMHYKVANGPWTTAPGIKMTPSTYNGYVQLDVEIANAMSVTAAFNNGNNSWDNNGGSNYLFQLSTGIETAYTVKSGTISLGAPDATQQPTATPFATPTITPTATPTSVPTYETVKIYYKANQANVHYSVNNGVWTTAPGVAMFGSEVLEYVTQSISVPTGGKVTAAFNNGNNVWDNNGGKNYTFTTGTWTVSNGQVTNGAPSNSGSGNTTTIYYPFTYTDRYGQLYLHYRVGNGAWTVAPGKLMSSSDVYMYNSASVDLGTATQLEFCIAKKSYYTNTDYSMDCNGGANYKVGKGNFTFVGNNSPDGSYYWGIQAGKPGENPTPTDAPTSTPTVTPTATPTATPTQAPTAIPTATPQPDMVTIYYKANQAFIHYAVNNGTWTVAPGTPMVNSMHPDYLVTSIFVPAGGKVTAAFNNGKGAWDNAGGKNYTFTAGTYHVTNQVVTSGQPTLTGSEKITTIYYPHSYTARYSYEYLHYRIGNGEWTLAPGKQLTYSDVSDHTYALVNLGTADKVEFCIAVRAYYSDANYNLNCNGGKNFIVGAGNFSFQHSTDANGNYSLQLFNGKPGQTTTPVDPPTSIPSNQVTVYYASSSTTYIHYKIDNGAWTQAPGKAMSMSTKAGFQTLVIDLGNTGKGITAAFNNGTGSWDSNFGKNYSFTAGVFTVKNGAISVGAPSN